MSVLIWIETQWHKFIIGATGIIVLVVHGEVFIEKFCELFGINRFVERTLTQRRHEMINLAFLENLPKDLALLATIVPKIQTAIPLIQKNAADISQAIADQKNPEQEVLDINALLVDLSLDLTTLQALLPPAAAKTTV